MMRLKGKIAVITGGSRGIGSAIARKFSQEGANVVINYRASQKEADELISFIRQQGGEAYSYKADVSSEEQVRNMFLQIKEKFGKIDVLVNNAGLADKRIWNLAFEETDLETVKRVFEVDSFGTFLCSKYASMIMERGSIINVASTPSLVGDMDGLVYAFAKGSVISLTKMLARYLAPRIRVNCMVLGSFRTSWLDWLSKEQLKSYVESIPLKRLGEPEEVANLAVFLASDESSFITGQSIVIDGGEAMR